MKVIDLLNNNRDNLLDLKRNGIITSTVFHHMSIYRDFKSMSGYKMKKYAELAEKYNLSEKQIRRIITKLSKTAK